MFDVLGIFKNVATVVDSIGNSVDKLSTTAEEKGRIKIELQKLQNNLAEHSLKLQMAIVEQENKLIEKSQALLLADAKSDKWIQFSWRPLLSLSLGGIVIIKYLIDVLYSFGIVHNTITFDSNFWLAAGGLWGITSLGRGIEKTVRNYKPNGLPPNIKIR